MSGVRSKLRHAFAVDPPGPAEPTPEQAEVVERICRQVAKRHLSTPGLIAMEMSRPLNFLCAQFLQFVSPAVWAIARKETHDSYQEFASFLEKRGSIEYMCGRIEALEAEYTRGECAIDQDQEPEESHDQHRS